VFIPCVVYVGPVVNNVAQVLVFLGALCLLCSKVELHQFYVLVCQQREAYTTSPVCLGFIRNHFLLKELYSKEAHSLLSS